MTYQEFIKEWSDNNPFFTAHTSGSTGIPKEIQISREVAIESAKRTIVYFQINENTRLHSCISPDFIGGKMMAVRAALADAHLSWETPSNHPVLITVDDHGNRIVPDFVAVVPSQMLGIMELLNSSSLSADEKSKIRTNTVFLCGGAPVNDNLADRIIKENLRVFESYGMTETCSHIALRRVGQDFFTPLDSITVTTDKRQCLVIEVPHLNPIVTNDIAILNPDGSFRILGRYDNVIISGGKKIFPEEIEKTLLPGLSPYDVTDIMAYGRKDNLWGEILCIDIECDKETDNVNIIEICRNLAASLLPSWQRPKQIRIVSRLPRTPNGKLDRKMSAK